MESPSSRRVPRATRLIGCYLFASVRIRSGRNRTYPLLSQRARQQRRVHTAIRAASQVASLAMPVASSGHRGITTVTYDSCLNGYEPIETAANGFAPWRRRSPCGCARFTDWMVSPSSRRVSRATRLIGCYLFASVRIRSGRNRTFPLLSQRARQQRRVHTAGCAASHVT
jgi:hypothetical protein